MSDGDDNLVQFPAPKKSPLETLEDIVRRVRDLELELSYAKDEIKRLKGRNIVARLLGR